ncbi:MAG: methionyl-tRNA formyltransferase [Elusimicrobiota bacterium]
MKIIFYGTGNVSLKFLEYLHKNEEVVAVVTSYPRPSGRGLKVVPTPVADFARESEIRLFIPEKLTVREIFDGLMPDLGVVVAYGKILPKSIIDYPPGGTINVHFSLLPKYRGAAPIQWALIRGEKKTGVTVFYLDEGIDTGKIIIQEETEITDEDNSDSLQEKLIEQGIKLLGKALGEIEKCSGRCKSTKQEGEPSYAPPLKKTDGLIDWDRTSAEINNLVKGTHPWPGAYSFLKTKEKKIYLIITKAIPLEVCPGEKEHCLTDMSPGDITGFEKGLGFVVKCKKGFLLVKRLKPEGKKEMSCWDFIQGARVSRGDSFKI